MSSLSNLIRGLSLAGPDSPGAVDSSYNHAMRRSDFGHTSPLTLFPFGALGRGSLKRRYCKLHIPVFGGRIMLPSEVSTDKELTTLAVIVWKTGKLAKISRRNFRYWLSKLTYAVAASNLMEEGNVSQENENLNTVLWNMPDV